MISLKESRNIDFSQYRERDVLVVNTDSRGSSPDRAFSLVSSLLKNYDEELFPVVYKKIDSTLRGNIGYEIDAILKKTNISMGFMTPSFPEQERTVVDGVLMVWGKPLVLTEASSDAAAPVRESCIHKLVEQQSRYKVGWIDLAHVASGSKELREAVKREQERGNQILVFDAVKRSDLTNIADVAFGMDEKPLFIGSAGLAEEVAKKLSSLKAKPISPWKGAKSFKHILIVSGSASSVTHEQLRRVEQRKGIPSFQLSESLLMTEEESSQREENNLSSSIGSSLAQGHVIFRTFSERLLSREPGEAPIHREIPKRLGHITLGAVEKSNVDINDLAVIVTGGDTAMSLFGLVGIGGVEIVGEVLKGIVMGHLIGGKWNGLTVVTKAGAFGRENALEKIVGILDRESS